MTVCAVKECHNASDKNKKHSNIAFHRFPNEPTIAAKWIEKLRLNRHEYWWKPTKNTRICSIHFPDNEKYKTKDGFCRLRRNTVPSKNLNMYGSPSDSDNNDIRIDGHDLQEPQPGTSGTSNSAVLKSPTISLESSIFDSPRKTGLKKDLNKKKVLMRRLKRKIKMLQQKNRRLKKKDASLQQIISNLRKERYINKDIANILSENVFTAQLYNNMVLKKTKNKKRPMPKYTPEFRKFCLTLHFHSPRAYLYVRKTFNTCLPHPKTIYNWYRNIDGSPGLTDESFKLLKSKAECSDKKLVCALVADEMAIRPQNLKGGHGRVDLGTGTSDCDTLATEAYTFILVCLNEHWKIPLGYFLIHGLTGGHKANLIKMCLTKCEEAGVKVVAITFDGHSTNISAMELLGCNIKNPEKLKTTFKHPTANHNVAVFLDSCHMIKLVRNHFEDKKELLDQDNNKIAWDYLIKLNHLQEKEGLHIANKLTRKHLEFRNTIMKVKLASQLLSRSVSVALKFCRETLRLNDFQDSEGTEKFIMIFNNIFDIFNSRKLTQHGFCHPLSKENKTEIYDFLDEARNYILNLKIKTTRKRKFNENDNSIKIKIKSFEPALTVRCSPGFKGLLICIESLKYLFSTIVEGTQELNYITTYRLSQDHIELLFGSIRMHGGHNDNPNALQFKGSYRKLLCRMELQAGDTGNCVPLENIAILTCSSALTCINASSFSERFDDADDELKDMINNSIENDVGFDIVSQLPNHDDPNYTNHIVGYIAGNVVRHIMTRVKCQFCIENLLSVEKMWFHNLVQARDQGGLIFASEVVYKICSMSETCLRKYLKENPGSNSEQELCLLIIKTFIDRSLFPTSEAHINGKHHDVNLTRLIIQRYLRIRFFYEAKKKKPVKCESDSRTEGSVQIPYPTYVKNSQNQ